MLVNNRQAREAEIEQVRNRVMNTVTITSDLYVGLLEKINKLEDKVSELEQPESAE
ncbi:hypothetical protein PQE75_gp083 [Bacillus phage vB_BcoS-136]|uniref:Uncharacterized protein n=1 Tax=Bacillus phage vB_BcoS-136 TaxID=2419619 RepID=A0A3G3BVD8_9CAUD|nr:hypothetical protein PQE75_gp083 [Bacillus phage vB_BcoS-136]AYP68215.1 hypothetical protein vBBcoS136_00083 [Bacillus phage vB_BcoS-136]